MPYLHFPTWRYHAAYCSVTKLIADIVLSSSHVIIVLRLMAITCLDTTNSQAMIMMFFNTSDQDLGRRLIKMKIK